MFAINPVIPTSGVFRDEFIGLCYAKVLPKTTKSIALPEAVVVFKSMTNPDVALLTTDGAL